MFDLKNLFAVLPMFSNYSSIKFRKHYF